MLLPFKWSCFAPLKLDWQVVYGAWLREGWYRIHKARFTAENLVWRGRNVEDDHGLEDDGEIARVRYKYLLAISMTNLQGKEINWSWWTLVPQNRPIDYMLLPCL